MFHHPLSVSEIHRFLASRCYIRDVQLSLDLLTGEGKLYCFGNWYSLRNDPLLVPDRLAAGTKAGELLPVAYRIGRLLHQFPFVRGVGISGSLSKDVADGNADIDFFIITETNRLWIARTVMHILKKLSFVVNRQHWFCMNYFIDHAVLEMPEKNVFIATEVVTLKPVAGTAIHSFLAANRWAFDYFPNYPIPVFAGKKSGKASWAKLCVEAIFNNPAGDLIDTWLMKITRNRWLKKERERRVNIKGEKMSFRMDKHYARPNPDFFQKKILALYHQKLEQLRKVEYSGLPISSAAK